MAVFNFYAELEKYFASTPQEKILEDWAKSQHCDKIGPTVDELVDEIRWLEAEKWAREHAPYPSFVDDLAQGYYHGFKDGLKEGGKYEKSGTNQE